MLLCNLILIREMPYLVFDKKPENKGSVKAFNNRSVLADFVGISYNTLTDHFIRKRHIWHWYEEQGVFIIRFFDMEKGRQRVKRDKKGHNRNI